MPNTFVISQANQKEIDSWVAKFPPERKRSAVVAAIFCVQEQNGGWLSDAALNAVAEYLQLPPIEVYEVASFYDMFELKPAGKHKISVCTNVSCMLMGSEEIVSTLEQRLGIKSGETTADGKFTFREVECMGACAFAPMCQIDDKKYHLNITPEKVLALIDELAQES